MRGCAFNDADVFIKGVPISLETIPEYFLTKHMQSWGGRVVLPAGETWDSLVDTLEARHGRHLWHVSHWEEEEK